MSPSGTFKIAVTVATCDLLQTMERHATKQTVSHTAIAYALDSLDPGDETQRNFRYQSAYGVALLVGASIGILPYTALWCEHYEDFLCERSDGLFDGYQVKTRRSENGPWTTSDNQFRSSIKRFIRLRKQFPAEIGNFYFVSNTECSDSAEKTSIGRSPRQLRRSVLESASIEDLKEPFSTTLADLAKYCGCTEVEVFDCFARLEFIKGPGRESFDAEIAHDYVATIPRWCRLSSAELNLVRDSLVQLVFRASSVQIDSPERLLCPVDATDRRNPRLLAKRLEVGSVLDSIDIGSPFRYIPTETAIALGEDRGQAVRRAKKLWRGGLGAYAEMLESRARSTERHLIESVLLDPQFAETTLAQVQSVVYGECLEAHAEASLVDDLFGQRMLVEVNRRLREVATDRAPLVFGSQYELLSGVAMLLTGECKVWWSPRFDPDAEQ